MLADSFSDSELLFFIQFLERLQLTRLRGLEAHLDVHHREETLQFPLDFQRLNSVRDNEIHLLEKLLFLLLSSAQINFVYLLHYLILLELHLIKKLKSINTLVIGLPLAIKVLVP